jgi:hypothetical protein
MLNDLTSNRMFRDVLHDAIGWGWILKNQGKARMGWTPQDEARNRVMMTMLGLMD